jgi:arsenite methyltransferase
MPAAAESGGSGAKRRNAVPQKTDLEIHSAVREYYARKAKPAGPCCGPAAGSDAGCHCSVPSNYDSDQVADLPAGLADVSLGCGNPVSEIDIRPGDTVVDLGSGGGLDCFLAARKAGPAGRAIGIDMTPEMIAAARANAEKSGAANVEFRLGQIESIPVSDGEADVIISNCVINLSPDKPAVFREMFRVLRPGGRIAVSDIVRRGPLNPLVAKSIESWAGCVAGAWDAADYRRGLADAGFTGITVAVTPGSPASAAAERAGGLPFSALITARKP